MISEFVEYVKQTWKNKPNVSSPLNADRLNHMEAGIENNSKKIKETVTAVNELTEKTGNFIPMKYFNTGNNDLNIKFRLTTSIRAYIIALIISQGGQPTILTAAIDIGTHAITSWNQISAQSGDFIQPIKSVTLVDEGLYVEFNYTNIWGICQYWGYGIEITA